MAPQSIAVVGLGGIGGVAAAALHLAGRHDVLACVRRPPGPLAFRHPDGVTPVALRCLADPAEAGPVDWILLCTKAQDTAAAGAWLRRLTGPATRVAVLQNGLGHAERVRPFSGEAPVVPVVVYFNGERSGAGEVQLRRVAGHDMAVPDDAHGRAFAELLRGSLLGAHPAPDFPTLAWRKLLINIVANPLTALTRQRQRVLRRPDIHALGLALLEEAMAVGRAAGAALAPDEADRVWATLMTFPEDAGTSMYHDIMAGRSLEVEALTGHVVALGERYGIPTPLNRAMLVLLRATADGIAEASTAR
ncbi:2-dehydropantoate 2-reductase [Siccirubricoccus sp. KC 17139]|uniref:2-dehydropantoate 2-reductase n=1 Tax=Siccirubricoccus soli TaxID=2899147 RepID=A0ABT1D0D6_9PROT|nr:2-dehydropantoate 2-reductase [Siccirubricoccus soli]MCO6414745.1 2-dehydropantoate 2-reductase [Siccirubricoccus soli]MCP2680875.1 2-dehydropantoate 2-reductase [Siccirubricoccus soli]